ncbi:nucleotide exchange factor GrpE [Candidatus Sumerlaeota bacterium]|nr:nucleotide exchange factor GrpE [Candidatus Sumerlaeota bacterium]
MAKLFGNLFETEFLVDEKPETVLDLSAEKPPMRIGAGESPASGAKGNEYPDLLVQISTMLQDQDRLETLADDLRTSSRKPTDEEFANFFKKALAVLDSFDRIMHFAEMQPPSEETQNWLRTLGGVQSRLTKLFEWHGLQSMDPVGRRVDLNRHEVVEVIKTDSIPDETIVEVRQKGYMFNGKVLRDARVVVAKNERS